MKYDERCLHCGEEKRIPGDPWCSRCLRILEDMTKWRAKQLAKFNAEQDSIDRPPPRAL